ncbi:MAG TPA: ATP-binding protein [Firmicutes bacterium]|nr:ATP-binding protein [Bacillota bacterium]
MNKINVTVNKSHLITIGERLYTENLELLRELINNGYDADATEVRVSINKDELIIRDNGCGMDEEGLKQYFNIGSQFKKTNPVSPRFKRTRIGEFGIGKFSVLSNTDYFEMSTKKDGFAGKIVFNKKEWEKTQDDWALPFEKREPDQNEEDGTIIILRGLKREFDITAVENRLIETLPLKAPDFKVFLNEKELVPRSMTGRKMPFLEGTDFGIVHGEIIIVPSSRADASESGILVRSKHVAVKRMSFGLTPSQLIRITGEVNSDFLKLTSDRNDIMRDTPEFDAFKSVMDRIIKQVVDELDSESDKKENSRIKKAMKDVTAKIESALMKNADWCPPGLLPIAGGEGAGGAGAAAAEKEKDGEKKQKESKNEEKPKKKKKKRKPKLRQLTSSAMVKKMKIGQMNLALVLDHFGADGPESFLENSIIYINRDHPLYQRESGNKDRHIINIGRLICQEISIMSTPRNPRHAYDRQSKLLKDAFTDKNN